VNETPSGREEHEEISEQEKAVNSLSNAIYESNVIGSENSFLPSQAAFASTPATARHGTVQDSFATQGSDDPSWTASIESPFKRLNREITNLSAHTDQSLLGPLPTQIPLQDQNSSTSHAEILQSEKGKGRDTSNSILRNVLQHNLYSTADVSASSPLKYKGKPNTPVNKNLNPYLPPDVPPAKWNGVIDLRDPSMLTPRRIRRPASNRPTTPLGVDDDDDDSFIGLLPGMSPLVTMSPARPPRSSAELGLLKVGQTPAREASTRIKQDLLRDAQISNGRQTSRLFSFDGGDSKSSALPTPPSFSRYTRNFDYSTSRSITKDSSLESMIRHIRSDLQPAAGVSTTPGLVATSGLATTPGLRLRARTQALSTAEPRDEASHQATPVYENMPQDIDSDSDSLDEVNNTAHPSAAFLMASQGSHPYDDSFDSSNHSDDSLTDEDVGTGLVPIHPFANAVEDDGFDDDDSFDGFVPAGGDFQEETVFGVTPGERERIHAEGLRMMGQELLEDTIGKGAQIATGAEDSPTPASWAR
jgi:DASH complex subunit ASK1